MLRKAISESKPTSFKQLLEKPYINIGEQPITTTTLMETFNIVEKDAFFEQLNAVE